LRRGVERHAFESAAGSIRSIPVATGVAKHGFRDVIQKNFLGRIFAAWGAIRASSRPLDRIDERVMRRRMHARDACKLSRCNKDFLHRRETRDEIARRSK
jgi:hypothetical protein